MGKNSRKEYLAKIRIHYRKAGRREKGAILSEFCAVCGCDRKYAIRILNAKKRVPARKPGPKPVYDQVVIIHLKALWLAMDQMRSLKLRAAIALWMPYYEAECGGLPSDIKAKLLALSHVMNEIYLMWSLYQNHFSPARKLAGKTRINSRWVKKYDEPKTPYQRLLESSSITEEVKDRLLSIHSALNPFRLKKEIEKKLRRLLMRYGNMRHEKRKSTTASVIFSHEATRMNQ